MLLIAEARDVAQCPEELPRRLRAAVEGSAGVAVAGVYILPPKTLSKTTSGKVRRNEMLRRWEAGELERLAKVRAWSSLISEGGNHTLQGVQRDGAVGGICLSVPLGLDLGVSSESPWLVLYLQALKSLLSF